MSVYAIITWLCDGEEHVATDIIHTCQECGMLCMSGSYAWEGVINCCKHHYYIDYTPDIACVFCRTRDAIKSGGI